MVKVRSDQFILYLLLFLAGLLCFTYKNITLKVYAQTTPQPKVFLLNPQSLTANKAKIQAKESKILPAYISLIKRADKLLVVKPVSVIDKSQTPPSGDKHDYMSLSPYDWPDPSKPNGLPYIAKDGIVNPAIYKIPDRDNLNKMISTVKTLSLAYYFSNDQKYADHAVLFLKTWFINPDTKMNPNLNYAQGRVGSVSGGAGGIIDTSSLPQVIDSIELLNGASSLNSNDRNQLNQWFNSYLNWLLKSKFGKVESQQLNNHGTWYDVQVASIALYLGNTQLATHTIQNDMLNRIPKQIDQEGEQPLELVRTNSWDYSTFNLSALSDLASLANKININLWHYHTKDGRGIDKAVEFLVFYASGSKHWPYQQIGILNKNSIITPLTQAAFGLNNLQFWNTSMNLQGKNALNNEYLLYYTLPNN